MTTRELQEGRPSIFVPSIETPLELDILVDDSTSMSMKFGSQDLERAEGVRRAYTSLIFDLVKASKKGGEIARRFLIRTRFFATEVREAFPDRPGWNGIDVIAEYPDEVDDAGFPTSFLPVADRSGMTNARAAAEAALEDINPNRMVMFIWDGEPTTGGDPRIPMEEVRDSADAFHIRIARKERPVVLPSDPSELPDDNAKSLFDWSTVLTEQEVSLALELGLPAKPGSRAMAVNATPAILSRFVLLPTRRPEKLDFSLE